MVRTDVDVGRLSVGFSKWVVFPVLKSNVRSKKFTIFKKVCIVISRPSAPNRFKRSFLIRSASLPDISRCTANPSSRYKLTSFLLYFFGS